MAPQKRRLRLSLKRDEALRATRVSIGKQKLVYVLVADKRLRYPKGRSRIAYIGTTKKGVTRIAQSVAKRAEDILSLHGVRTFHARVVVPPSPAGAHVAQARAGAPHRVQTAVR